MAFKKIVDYTDDELKIAIENAKNMVESHGINWWELVKGIDSFFEQRNRKRVAEAAK